MLIAAKFTGLVVPPYRFQEPVDIYHLAVARTALADSTDVQLSSGQFTPVNRPVYFVLSIEVIQAYANGDGAAPIVTLKGSLTGSVAITAAGDAAGLRTTYQGVLLPNENLLFTPTAGTGTTETGTCRVSVTLMDPTKR